MCFDGNTICTMFLLKSREGSMLTLLTGAALPTAQKLRALFKNLSGQQNSYSMRALCLALVLLVHLSAFLRMLQPAKIVTQARPMMMEVSLLAAPGQQTAVAPVAQAKAEEPKKAPVKKPVKKKQPVVRKQMERPKPVAMAEETVPAPATFESAPAPVTPSPAVNAPSKTAVDTAPFTEADFNANYGSNPKPKYPGVATNRGWEGTVRLLVKVSVDGDSEEVSVHRSSGYDALDEAAIEAVEKWKFIPAKRGETPVASSVIVPINFVLNN